MHVAVAGTGAVGLKAARHAQDHPDVDGVTVISDDQRRAGQLVGALGPAARVGDLESLAPGAVVIAAGGGSHLELARAALDRGCGLVSTSGALAQVEGLLSLDAEARERGVAVVVGAAMAPGLTCLLARHAGAGMDHVEEVAVARSGSAGRACATERVRAASLDGWRWDHGWRPAARGAGQRIVWFPSPIGGRDCRYGALPEAVLLQRSLEGVERITARLDSKPWERLIPGWRARGQALGAVVVEVWGRRDGAAAVEVLGAVDRPGGVAGAVAALAAVATPGVAGACGVAELPGAGGMLARLAEAGVTAARFEGG